MRVALPQLNTSMTAAVIRPGRRPVGFGTQAPLLTTREAQLKRFNEDLRALAVRDLAQHPNAPVFKHLYVSGIVNLAAAYLQRQDRLEPITTPYTILISGCAGAGKSTVSQYVQHLGEHAACTTIPLDAYYHDLQPQIQAAGGALAFYRDHDCDTPAHVNLAAATTAIASLRNGHTTQVTTLDDHKIAWLHPKRMLLADGLFALQHKPMRALADLKIYVDASPDIRQHRLWERIRNGSEKSDGFELDHLKINGMLRSHQQHIVPSQKEAEIILDGDSDFETTVKPALKQLTEILQRLTQPAR